MITICVEWQKPLNICFLITKNWSLCCAVVMRGHEPWYKGIIFSPGLQNSPRCAVMKRQLTPNQSRMLKVKQLSQGASNSNSTSLWPMLVSTGYSSKEISHQLSCGIVVTSLLWKAFGLKHKSVNLFFLLFFWGFFNASAVIINPATTE